MTQVAAIQMCSSHSVDDNLQTAAKLIHEAAQEGATLIVLPEMFAIISPNTAEKLQASEADGHGKIQSFLSAQAKNNRVWLVGGTILIRDKDEHKASAACLVFNDEGVRVGRYDKIHLFDVTLTTETYKESDLIVPGRHLVVIDTPFGKLGLGVCYDIRFPELFRYLFNQGAEIIAIPSAFTIPTGEAHWELLMRSRAVENFCYMIGACQGGTHVGGRKTYGHSLIVEPWGTVIANKPGIEQGVVYANIDLKQLHQYRKSIPIENHQRIFFDVSFLNKEEK